MSFKDMIKKGISNNMYTQEQLMSLKETGIDMLVLDGSLTERDKLDLINLIDEFLEL